MDLFEYAAKNPQPIPASDQEAVREAARGFRELEDNRKEADRLKDLITLQMDKGQEPQTILYTALKCIGLLTNSPEWAREGQERLEGIYADIAQQSFLADQSGIALDRLNQTQNDYKNKLKRSTERQLRACQKIEDNLTTLIRTLNELERDEAEN